MYKHIHDIHTSYVNDAYIDKSQRWKPEVVHIVFGMHYMTVYMIKHTVGRL